MHLVDIKLVEINLFFNTDRLKMRGSVARGHVVIGQLVGKFATTKFGRQVVDRGVGRLHRSFEVFNDLVEASFGYGGPGKGGAVDSLELSVLSTLEGLNKFVHN
jgi:hypothetical protein